MTLFYPSGTWSVSREADPASGETNVYATVQNGSEILGVACTAGEKFTVARVTAVDLSRFTDRPDQPAYRFDQRAPADVSWFYSAHSALLSGDDAIRFADQMAGARIVHTRLVVVNGQPIDEDYSLAGSEAAVAEVRAACGVPSTSH